MNQETYQDWLENPATEYFFKYLKDESKEEARLLAEIIMGGNILSDEEQIRVAAECATLIRISELEYTDIEIFYQEKEG